MAIHEQYEKSRRHLLAEADGIRRATCLGRAARVGADPRQNRTLVLRSSPGGLCGDPDGERVALCAVCQSEVSGRGRDRRELDAGDAVLDGGGGDGVSVAVSVGALRDLALDDPLCAQQSPRAGAQRLQLAAAAQHTADPDKPDRAGRAEVGTIFFDTVERNYGAKPKSIKPTVVKTQRLGFRRIPDAPRVHALMEEVAHGSSLAA